LTVGQELKKEIPGHMTFTGVTITFLKQFAIGLEVTFPILFSLAAIVALLGQAVGTMEGWSRFDSSYWSFITATTVGYGDIRPLRRASKIGLCTGIWPRVRFDGVFSGGGFWLSWRGERR
jgi:voltage-gated potassium channel